MSDWTPGTWETDKRGFSPTIDIIVRGETMVATVQASYADYDEERTAANANLIAAAPDLYAACEWVLDRLVNHYGDVGELSGDLEAALAKARGEEVDNTEPEYRIVHEDDCEWPRRTCVCPPAWEEADEGELDRYYDWRDEEGK